MSDAAPPKYGDEFDPPKYIEKLIAAINDGAKSAQLGALAFVAIGLFLLATSFSATDEDLLMNRAITISQLGGTQVPVVLSFGFMPAVFVAVHLYTLIRYDLLSGNVRQFLADLPKMVLLEDDQERCRQLLANVEFVQALVVPDASWVFRWTVRGILAVFPVMTLLLVQLGSLRLQSYVVNVVHHVAILTDLVLLLWFFQRQGGEGGSIPRWMRARRLRWVLPVLVVGFDLAWCEVPGAEATTVGVGKDLLTVDRSIVPDLWDESTFVFARRVVMNMVSQPVDLVLCPFVRIGCRYLSVPGRTLVAKVWDNGAFVELRAGAELNEKRRASFDKAILQGRMLRFADLSASQLFMADLAGASLQGARLDDASLQGARLDGASMQGATLNGASLQGARLDRASLQGARLDSASLQGASLDGASLQGALLYGASLQGALLDGASLQGALLYGASLQGASLYGASLQGARLDGASLQGATLERASLWNVSTTVETKMSLGDLRNVNFQPMSSEAVDAIVASVPERSRETLRQALTDRPDAARLGKVGTQDGPILVSNVSDPRWVALDQDQRTDVATTIAERLARLLADDVASISEATAYTVMRRLFTGFLDPTDKSTDPLANALRIPLGCRLLAHAASKRVSLSEFNITRLRELTGTCPGPAPSPGAPPKL